MSNLNASSTYLASLSAGEDLPNNISRVEQHFSYANITGQATTTVKNGAGFLHAITFNKPVATQVITIYDNTTNASPVVGTITIPSSPMPVTLFYDITLSTGLTIVTATASSDITVSYR